MNFRFLLLILIIFTSLKSFSQPVISYILPDIGSPGMNVYVEFISPVDSLNDNFGTDGASNNNPGNPVQVVLADPAKDASKIVIGPLVVSWGGRVISTQIFVNHQIKPNSIDALSATPEFQISLKVIVNNKESNRVTFYIVKSRPYLNAALYPSESILGEGNLGIRSPRGAMIFDSIKLDNKKYRVSVKDCDPNTDGNQAYLPFTLLVRGNITGSGSNSQVSVDGGDNGDGLVQNAGPGGGGGGGSFMDTWNPSDIGMPGGNGFTGGGPGGSNNYANKPSSKFTAPSKGSGPYNDKNSLHGGYSLNGLSGPKSEAYEAAGGGTGHPFGLFGLGCDNGGNCEPTGGYGGGSGYFDDSPGGAGGYAAVGQGKKNNGGQIHGNRMVVPVAGGSGGAGGNPKCPEISYRSGAGGAGGGSLRIFALNISNIKVTANGANGADNGCQNSWGGSGSGGHAGLQAKIGIDNSLLQVDGGFNSKSAGGAGRARYDAPQSNNVNITNPMASTYIGPTSDTSLWIKKNQIITGSHENSSSKSTLYLRSQNTNWKTIGSVTAKNWTFDLTNELKNANEKIFYFTVLTEVQNFSAKPYINEPRSVMSQAAANIFFLDVRPFIGGDTTVKSNNLYCNGDTIFLSAKITNLKKADEILNIKLSDNWLSGDNGFKIIGPLGDYSIKPGDTADIIVRYVADITQSTSNTLIIPSDDPDRQNGKDWQIFFKVPPSKKSELTYEPPLTVPVDIPDTKIGQSRIFEYLVKNTGETKLYIDNVDLKPPFQLVSTNPPLPSILDIGKTLYVTLKFTPPDEKQYTTQVIINAVKTDSTCSLVHSTDIIGHGVQSDIRIEKTVIDFGLIPYCNTVKDTIRISNDSNASASFQINEKPQIIGTDPQYFTMDSIKRSYPLVFTKGDGVMFGIEFGLNGGSAGPKNAIFRFTTDNPDSPINEIVLKGEFVPFNTVSTPDKIDLGNIAVGFDSSYSFTLSNFAKINEKISSIKSSFGSISFLGPSNQIIDSSGGTSVRNFTINPKKAGIITDTIFVAFDEPCLDTIKIPFTGNGITSKPLIKIDNDTLVTDFDTTKTRNYDFGIFPVCKNNDTIYAVEFINDFDAPYIVIDENLIPDPSGKFSLDRTGLNYPDTLKNSRKRIGAQIFFNSSAGIPGIYTAVLILKIYANGNFYEYKINLKAEIFDGKYTFNPPDTIKIETIVMTTNTMDFTITNAGPRDLVLEPNIGPTLLIFEINPDPDGFVLSKGQSQTFTISFTPTEIKSHIDSIIFKLVNSSCEEWYVLYLNGTGKPSKELTVWIDTIVTTPDQNNFKIPIYGKFSQTGDSLNDFSMIFKLKFNRSLFYPDKSDANIIENYIDSNNRVIKLKLEHVNLSPSDTLISYLTGTTMLGDTIKTSIEFDSLFVTPRELISTWKYKNGLLTIEICNQGGKRLLKNEKSPASIIAIPNPVNDVFIVKVITLEKGNHNISIFDLQGNKSLIYSWYNNNPGDEISVSVDTQKFASGLYYLELAAPTQVKVINLNIIK